MATATSEKLVAVEAAARELGVDYAELLYWLLSKETVRMSPAIWSAWRKGTKPVGEKHLLDFMKERQRVGALIPIAMSRVVEHVREEIQRALASAPVETHGRIIAHFQGQVSLIATLSAATPMPHDPSTPDASTALISGEDGVRRAESRDIGPLPTDQGTGQTEPKGDRRDTIPPAPVQSRHKGRTAPGRYWRARPGKGA